MCDDCDLLLYNVWLLWYIVSVRNVWLRFQNKVTGFACDVDHAYMLLRSFKYVCVCNLEPGRLAPTYNNKNP